MSRIAYLEYSYAYFITLGWLDLVGIDMWEIDFLCYTVIILSFWTDRPGQTVLTQVQSDPSLHCLPSCLHLLDSLLYGRVLESHCWNFRIITAILMQSLYKLAVLETAGRIVAKCDQTLVWATKFFPKDRPENEFGRPNLGRGYRMFSAYLQSISRDKYLQNRSKNLRQ